MRRLELVDYFMRGINGTCPTIMKENDLKSFLDFWRACTMLWRHWPLWAMVITTHVQSVRRLLEASYRFLESLSSLFWWTTSLRLSSQCGLIICMRKKTNFKAGSSWSRNWWVTKNQIRRVTSSMSWETKLSRTSDTSGIMIGQLFCTRGRTFLIRYRPKFKTTSWPSSFSKISTRWVLSSPSLRLGILLILISFMR